LFVVPKVGFTVRLPFTIALYVCRYIFFVRTENVLFIAGYDDIYRTPSHSLQCRSSVSHATNGELSIHDVSENYAHLM